MNIENISKYIAAIPALLFSVLITSLTALPFILVILENPLSVFDIAFAFFGLTVTFFVLLLSLDIFLDIFTPTVLYFLVFLIQSSALIKTMTRRIKNSKTKKGAA
ncbi:hypothetical protein [Pseudomonas amygdali]|uniref:hypothetical protein n=1 Tax=Pseudomonas amygdali TaxID=47877 RepID=UPI000709A805|nr:hypothetical protein [Pseudomonas amygdali]KWS79708.1 hypothetical protein AL052_25345 [Pseudomonas amygdali pv. eriobotryae]